MGEGEREVHVRTFAAHGDGVRDADSVELPADHSAAFNGALDELSKVHHYPRLGAEPWRD